MEQYFKQLPENSKVWVYQSNRELNDSEVQQIKSLINEFVRQWTSHSRNVIAAAIVVYKRFIILAADESAFSVSGCSIDSSIHFVKELEQQFNIGLFDRHTVAYRGNEKINAVKQADFQQLIDNGLVNQDTVVFNNLVATVGDLNQNWEVPLSRSWHARVFKTGAAA